MTDKNNSNEILELTEIDNKPSNSNEVESPSVHHEVSYEEPADIEPVDNEDDIDEDQIKIESE